MQKELMSNSKKEESMLYVMNKYELEQKGYSGGKDDNAYGFPCADAEMDAEPVGVRAGSAHAVYFRLRPLYAVLPGVVTVFDLAGGGVWMLCVDFHGCFDRRCSRTL